MLQPWKNCTRTFSLDYKARERAAICAKMSEDISIAVHFKRVFIVAERSIVRPPAAA